MHRFVSWAESHREHWLDCIRIYLGLALFARGLMLVFDIRTEFFLNLLSHSDQEWIVTGLLLHYVTLAHFVGGALLIVGLLTRIAALVQIPILAGAVFIVHRQDGLFALGQSLELSALVLFLLVVVLIAGPGPLSLDAAMADRKPLQKTAPHIA
jgi:uncharacterized membrane protein YphA (DoxX/SURF4 family)